MAGDWSTPIRESEFVAITDDAHVALWHALLNIDLVGVITSRQLAEDDPLPYLVTDYRALRTTSLADGVWVNLRDVAASFAARTYATDDRIVVEAGGQRWGIDGGPDGASCKQVRSRADLTTTHAGLGALLYGGVTPSMLASGRRLTARNDEALRRADAFFRAARAPHCQTWY